MTESAAVPPEAPDAVETARFLCRFAGMMANGQNAHYLLRAAELLASLTASLAAASNDEQVLRYKHETLTQHSDALEAECQRLRNDIEGHVNVAGLILAERDQLRKTLEEREARLLEVGGALLREQDQSAKRSQAHEADLAGLRTSFEQERLALAAAAEVSGKEVDQQRRVFDRERQELLASLKSREAEAAELQQAFDREREQLRSEIENLRASAGREQQALMARIEALEAKRAELRSTFERISSLRAGSTDAAADRPTSDQDSVAMAVSALTGSENRDAAMGQASAVVPKETLRQARAQFDFLARESFRRGDVATQAMCEVGAHTIELALVADERTDPLPVGEVARSILAPPD